MSPAIGFCQGSPMRAELEALDPSILLAWKQRRLPLRRLSPNNSAKALSKRSCVHW
jgi:hypothetical protein